MRMKPKELICKIKEVYGKDVYFKLKHNPSSGSVYSNPHYHGSFYYTTLSLVYNKKMHVYGVETTITQEQITEFCVRKIEEQTNRRLSKK